MSLRRTPLVPAPTLSAATGIDIWLKLECLQRTGSFKARGAARAIAALGDEERERGVVTASAGNHGAGLALAGSSLGVEVTVFVPERTPSNKVQRIEGLGATLRIEGKDYDDSERLARLHAAEAGVHFVSAFDDPEVMAGNGGELGREILEQCPEVARILVPVGGGGLIAGMALELANEPVELIGTQPEKNCAMRDSLILGRALVEYEGEHTIAEGCEGAVCERTYRVVRDSGLRILTCSEEAIESAIVRLYRDCGVVVEASAAVPLATLMEQGLGASEAGPTVLVLSGGNIDSDELDALLAARG